METLTFVAAQAAGAAGVICLATLPLARTRVVIPALQTAMGRFAVHHALPGIAAAAAISMLGAAPSAAAFGAGRWPWLSRIACALIPVIVGAALWLWEGPITLLAAASMTLIALGRMQAEERRLRLMILAGCGFWILHDALGGAWLVLAGDLISAATGSGRWLIPGCSSGWRRAAGRPPPEAEPVSGIGRARADAIRTSSP